MQVIAATDADAAIVFTANPKITSPKTNQFLAFKDCSLVGKYKTVIQRSGADTYSNVTWSRVTTQLDEGKPALPLVLP